MRFLDPYPTPPLGGGGGTMPGHPESPDGRGGGTKIAFAWRISFVYGQSGRESKFWRYICSLTSGRGTKPWIFAKPERANPAGVASEGRSSRKGGSLAAPSPWGRGSTMPGHPESPDGGGGTKIVFAKRIPFTYGRSGRNLNFGDIICSLTSGRSTKP